jgi:hypothetical protein
MISRIKMKNAVNRLVPSVEKKDLFMTLPV